MSFLQDIGTYQAGLRRGMTWINTFERILEPFLDLAINRILNFFTKKKKSEEMCYVKFR
jgi:hypothetical protein